MRLPACLPVCLFVAAGCAAPAPSSVLPQSASVAAPSGVLLDNFDRSVDPGDDFHRYVNGGWMASNEIPADKGSYGVGAILRERSQEDVRRIIEDTANGDFPPGSAEQKVGDLYSSYMDMETRDRLGVAPLQRDLARIDALTNHSDLARYFAYANKVGFNPPLALVLFPDLKNPTYYAFYTWQGGLGLPDREFYFAEDEKSREIRDAYVEHIEKMLTLSGIGGGVDAAQRIMTLETALAERHMKKEQTRNIPALYNPIQRDTLSDLMPRFDWPAYLDEAGVTEAPFLVMAMLDYSRALDDIVADTDLETWKTFLKWKALDGSAAQLTAALDRQNFEFYTRMLTGAEEQLPLWRRGVSVVNENLGEVVGAVYVKRHFPPAAKERMLELVNNLLRAYEISIRELDWMGPDTREQALDKLSKFTPKIGYPDIWKDYSALSINAGDLYGNMQRSALVEYQRDLDKYGGPVQKHEWGMTPQTVNAYYNPPQNEIVFPAAILQPPYFDMEADLAVSYGAIGGVIGHEIGHGFDDSGSTFDGDGVLRDWWTAEDKAEFSRRTEALVAQYDEFEALDGLNVNGTFTLGENIGDLGGLSIALKAYELSLNGKPAPVIDGFTGEQRVFIGWAQAWLKIERDAFLRQQVSTDPHSPARFRVNGVVRNIPEFYSAFDVKPGDALYLPPEERVKIW